MKIIFGKAVFLLFIFSQGLTAEFCFRSGVSRETIQVHFQSSFKSFGNKDGKWELSAFVTWQRPNTTYDFPGYAVRAGKTKDIVDLSFRNCSLSGLQTTEEESYMFTGLQFGYKYNFGVSLVRKSRLERESMETVRFHVETPDCYLETRDIEFCKDQSVEISGAPLHFQVDCASAVTPEKNEPENSLYTVALSWTRPIQVNGNISTYELRYRESNFMFVSSYSESVEAHKDILVYGYVLYDLLESSNYTATVRAFVDGKGGPRAGLNFSTYDDQLNNYSHPNEKICSKLEDNAVKTTFLPTTPKTSVDRAPIVGVGAGLLLAAVVAGCILTICYVVKKKNNLAESKEAIFVRYLDDEGRKKDSDVDRTCGELREPNADFQATEIDRSHLVVNEKLGNGQFGIVYSGILNPQDKLTKKNVPRPVAIKSLKLNATRETKEDFLDEIRFIIDIGCHPNILQILGCCTVDEPYYLITEFMKYGDLLGFVWKCRNETHQAEDPIYCLTETGQLQIARQIARGMEYLSNTRYYHGDLAARNVLVGEGLTVKISDFGMADDIYQRGYKRLGQEKKRPLKWVSLETNTKGTCSIKSDVWSFGIVLYEIYTLGGVPYPGMDGFEVVRKLEDGYRMEQPDCCPDQIYIIMLECWHEKPELRPTFTNLFNKLDQLLGDMSSEYLTAELDFGDHFSEALGSNTHEYENNKLLIHGSDNIGSHYDSLKAVGWKTVPRVTVECFDVDQ